MKRFLMGCAAAVLLSTPALAGSGPTMGQPGYFGQVRGESASHIFNPSNPSSPVPNIGKFFFSSRAGSNSTNNIMWMNQSSGMHIPATLGHR